MSDIYAQRRHAFLNAIPGGVAVIPTAHLTRRNSDVEHRFRPASDFFYLTGFEEPDAVAVLRPGAETPFVLFVPPRDREKEIWNGRRAGVEGARARFGADAAYELAELDKRLPDLIDRADTLYYSLGEDPAFDARMVAYLKELRTKGRLGKRAPRAIVELGAVLHEMRLRKQDFDLAALRRASDITCEAHRLAMGAARPGRSEYQVEAVVEYCFRATGGRGFGYPSIIASGPNACILHYRENDRVMKDGDLLLVDAGAEVDCFTADVTRTFPVSGRFTPAQRRVYEVVLDAQKRAIAATKPGATIDGLHAITVRALTEGMVALGLLKGSVDELIEKEKYKAYYMHRTSHWLGMDVHDVGSYQLDGSPRPLEPGFVLTVEPGLYIAEDANDAPSEYRGIGVRIEDDVLVTAAGHEILTADAPKEVADVEAAVRAGISTLKVA